MSHRAKVMTYLSVVRKGADIYHGVVVKTDTYQGNDVLEYFLLRSEDVEAIESVLNKRSPRRLCYQCGGSGTYAHNICDVCSGNGCLPVLHDTGECY